MCTYDGGSDGIVLWVFENCFLNTRVGILYFWALALSFNLLFSLFHSEFPTKNNSLQSPQLTRPIYPHKQRLFLPASLQISIALPDPVQTRTNCIFLFIALTACNVASGIRVFPCGTQYPWKYKIFPSIPLKSNSKNIFYNFTSEYELDHLLSHFTRAIDRLKVLKKKKEHFVFLTFNNSLRIADI